MSGGRSYPAIGEHAFLSDCHSGALVGPDGSVDWLCAPRFDGDAVFARLLDRRAGGAWELTVNGAGPDQRRYSGPTLVLESRWREAGADVVAHDFLAVKPPGSAGGRGLVPTGALVRLVRCRAGRARVRFRVAARPDHGERAARWDAGGQALVGEHGLLWLAGEPQPQLAESDGAVVAEAELAAGDGAALALGYDGGLPRAIDRAAAERMLEQTLDAWRAWAARNTYDGFAAAEVERSALVLRGLIFDESGAMLAAPTTSLPEWIGGERNWDYRYAWHRDAALVVLALLRLDHAAEAGRYLRFLLAHCAHCDDELEPMLAIDGGTEMPEAELRHLEGYRSSAPVRVGNAAREQRQLDTYGHVLDAALAYHQVTGDLDDASRDELWRIVEMCRQRWREPDHGKWEVRGEPRHWTNSKLYAWVCLDRGVQLAELAGDRAAPLDGWRRERTALRGDLLANGWSAECGAFVQSYGSRALDASVLRLPLVGFLAGDDPRVLATLERLDAELGSRGHLLDRYDPEETEDGLAGPEGAFLLCSFDMVSALVLAGRSGEARERFEALCGYGEPFGLLPEQVASDGTLLGNYPQAFSHLALIDAALNIDEAGRRDALHAWAAGARAGSA